MIFESKLTASASSNLAFVALVTASTSTRRSGKSVDRSSSMVPSFSRSSFS